MIRNSNFPAILLASMALYLLIAVTVSTAAYAAQNNTVEAVQNAPAKISGKITGKVTDIITSSGITYAEVDAGKEKVWAAGPVDTALKKGDVVTFSTEMAMQNYHSKYLGRDFPVIYFIKHFITDKEATTITTPHEQIKKQPVIKPVTTTSSATPGEVKVGGYLREATLDGLNGKSKNFSEYRGKPLIINMWASWCGPCRAEMGSLKQLAQRYNGKQFNIIGISTDDYRNKAEAFIRQAGITFENFIDHNLLLENMLGANTLPLTILVDEQGRILQKVRGAREWDSPEIVDAIGDVFRIKLM